MLKGPSTFRKGLSFAVAWLAWFVSGLLYASSAGPIKALVSNMPSETKMYFSGWLLVSSALLFYAIVFLIRGWLGRTGR